MEEWKTVPNTEGRYEVSTFGRLRTNGWKGTNQIRVMKPAKDANGYLRTMIKINGRLKTVKIHRLVAEVFIPNPENKPQVNHIDFNRSNNAVSNLEWCTFKENIQHSIDAKRFKWNGVMPPKKLGSQVGNSKLTEDQVREIRKKFKPRVYTREMLAQEYGVSSHTIKDCILRRWKHVI